MDLAAGAKNTATCLVLWDGERPLVEAARVGVDDDVLLSLVRSLGPEDLVGIDSPLGWPQAFVEAVSAHARGGEWPGRGERGDDVRPRLRLRETDRVVKRVCGANPISVSTDKLGATAIRCAHLLDALAAERGAVLDRSGVDGVVEVYPAAARRVWGLRPDRSIGEVTDAVGLDLAEGVETLLTSEHAFDALVCGLVARAYRLGQTLVPTPEQIALARVEGWIHLPKSGSLVNLAASTIGNKHA